MQLAAVAFGTCVYRDGQPSGSESSETPGPARQHRKAWWRCRAWHTPTSRPRTRDGTLGFGNCSCSVVLLLISLISLAIWCQPSVPRAAQLAEAGLECRRGAREFGVTVRPNCEWPVGQSDRPACAPMLQGPGRLTHSRPNSPTLSKHQTVIMSKVAHAHCAGAINCEASLTAASISDARPTPPPPTSSVYNFIPSLRMGS